MGKVIEQMEKFYPELKIAYAVQGNKLGTKVRDQGAPCLWYPWDNSGLVLQAQVHWLQEDQGLVWMKLTWW